MVQHPFSSLICVLGWLRCMRARWFRATGCFGLNLFGIPHIDCDLYPIACWDFGIRITDLRWEATLFDYFIFFGNHCLVTKGGITRSRRTSNVLYIVQLCEHAAKSCFLSMTGT
ncbi:hypothetical protein BJY00DRAFT_257500 [Aspergillus carlsbadensis]|nr:hypothetical protein BJY00DRAFT_257500 [Aspergillus carlsbadensis]